MKTLLLPGFQYQSDQASKILSELQIDHKIFSGSPPKSFNDPSKVDFIPLPFKILNRIIGLPRPKRLKELDTFLYRKAASTKVSAMEYNFLHGWASFSLDAFVKAKELSNSTLFLERACPHIFVQEDILRPEYEFFGLPANENSKKLLEVMIAEYEMADLIIVPSTYTKDSFEGYGLSHKVVVATLSGNNSTQPKYLTQKRTFTVGAIGGNVIRKGFIYLLQAWAKAGLKDSKLVLRTSHEELKKIPKISAVLNNCRDVEIISYLPNVSCFFDGLDLMILPSIDEGYGMVVEEALSAGVPTSVSTNVGSKDRVKETGAGSIFPIRDAECLANVLKAEHARFEDSSIDEINHRRYLISERSQSREKANDYSTTLRTIYREGWAP